jgi:UrcA family protein
MGELARLVLSIRRRQFRRTIKGMKIMNRLSPLAFAAAILATGATVMASAPGQAATVHVGYADLDLSTASGRDTLDSRIDHAANTACWIENRTLSAAAACRRESVADARNATRHAVQSQVVQLAAR